MAPTYQTRVLSMTRCGVDVVLGELSVPKAYEFKAGQWFRLTLETSIGSESRTFSHAAAPSDGVIGFATRLSPTTFKAALGRLAVGDTVEISAPGGRLTLPRGADRLGFLAGGVGITPIRSLLRDAVAGGRSLDEAVLLYGNRDESCIPYREELEELVRAGLVIVHVLERPETGWDQETGYITADMVRRHATIEGRAFVVSGPPVMVDAMERVLDELGVPPESRAVERFGPRQPVVAREATSGRK